jgi:hypothetical protein
MRWESGHGGCLSGCRRIGERGMAEYDGCIIEPLGRVYIDVQVVDLE